MTAIDFRSIDAASGEPFGDPLRVDGPVEVAAACAAAEAAFDAYRETGLEERARFLDAIAAEIEALGDVLIDTAVRESGLPRARIAGERGRTIGQLRLFAGVVRSGEWQRVAVDPALPERQPLPRPDLRRRMVPVGPVAVFGASNFPLAFSTAGGDTASALAAGCPVVVKGHPAHPGAGTLVAAAIRNAVTQSGMPDGTFSHLSGPGTELGAALVRDPRIAAVGFTGSRAGGLALDRIARDRDVPIPVFAEMSSINPVLLLPAALADRPEEIAAAFVASLTQGAGQFCTNPGLVVAIAGDDLDTFARAATARLAETGEQTMLTSGIRAAFESGVALLAGHASVRTLAHGAGGALFLTDAAGFAAHPALAHEVFGASSLIVACSDEAELAATLAALEGQLTVTLHLDAADHALAGRLMPVLERKAGRILANGWPTGVEVASAMVHGGPFPATTDSRSTSVGTLAIERFLRPVCYQALPNDLLPPALRG